uniref:SRY-box containing gene 21a n=1 Tax=Mycena chlorophos TaxID=658473 RepID=A0ABQ0L4Y9_MYCCL|nr:SRY-box containing gene 21a [Mycena chlorophos]
MRLSLTIQSADELEGLPRLKYNQEDTFTRGNAEVRTFIEDSPLEDGLIRPFILRFVGVIEGRATDYLEPDSGPMQRLTLVAPPGEHQQSFVKTARFLASIMNDENNFLWEARSENKWCIVPHALNEAKIYVHYTHSARMVRNTCSKFNPEEEKQGEVEEHRAFEGVHAYSGDDTYIHLMQGDWVWVAARLVREDYAYPSVHTRKITWLVKAFHLSRILLVDEEDAVEEGQLECSISGVDIRNTFMCFCDWWKRELFSSETKGNEDYLSSMATFLRERYPTLLRHRLGLELDPRVTVPALSDSFARTDNTVLYPVIQTLPERSLCSISFFGLLEAVFQASPMHCVLMLKSPGEGRLADAFHRTAEFLEEAEAAWRNSIHRPIQVYGCVVRDQNPLDSFILVHIATPTRFNRRLWSEFYMPDILPTIPFAFDDSDVLEQNALLRCQVNIFKEESSDLDGRVWNSAWVLAAQRVLRIYRSGNGTTSATFVPQLDVNMFGDTISGGVLYPAFAMACVCRAKTRTEVATVCSLAPIVWFGMKSRIARAGGLCSASTATGSLAPDENLSNTPARARPHAHVPRPRNAFFVFRSSVVRKRRGLKLHQALQSKAVADVWRTMSEDERRPYQEVAAQEREEHAQRYPNYKYRPRRRAAARKRKTHFNSAANLALKDELVDEIVRVQDEIQVGEELHDEREVEECVYDVEEYPWARTQYSSPVSDHDRDPMLGTLMIKSESASWDADVVGLGTMSGERTTFASNEVDRTLSQVLFHENNPNQIAEYFGDVAATLFENNVPWGSHGFVGVQDMMGGPKGWMLL